MVQRAKFRYRRAHRERARVDALRTGIDQVRSAALVDYICGDPDPWPHRQPERVVARFGDRAPELIDFVECLLTDIKQGVDLDDPDRLPLQIMDRARRSNPELSEEAYFQLGRLVSYTYR